MSTSPLIFKQQLLTCTLYRQRSHHLSPFHILPVFVSFQPNPEEKMKQSPRILACSKTDQGLRRPRNEDVCMADKDHRFFMVADGMGGRAGGDVASALFLEAVIEIFGIREELPPAKAYAKIEAAFSLANKKILAHVAFNPHHAGMGCTAELLIFCRNYYLLGHVGDSRTYVFRNGRLIQLTHDHSLVQAQLERGEITPGQAQTSRFRNVLLRAVGVDTTIAVDILSGRFHPGDIFLLCTDGLHGMLGNGEIESVLAFHASLPMKADMLIKIANDAGGNDNISVTLAEIIA